jgi:hypothetical protein
MLSELSEASVPDVLNSTVLFAQVVVAAASDSVLSILCSIDMSRKAVKPANQSAKVAEQAYCIA